MAQTSSLIYPISATSANWLAWWITLFTKWFRNIDVQFYAPALSSFVFKFVVSMQESKPDFTSAPSASNQWSYVQAVDLNTWNAVDGTTWVTVSWEAYWSYEINANNGSTVWIWILVSSYSAGSFTWNYVLSTNA